MDNSIPNYYHIGEAVHDEGDGLFESIAQTLRQIRPSDTNVTTKGLRLTCKHFAIQSLNSNDGNWLQSYMDSESKNGQEHLSLQEYIPRIEFSMQDIVQEDGEAKTLALSKTIEGRPEVEGRIICHIFGVKLHVIRNQNIDGKLTWFHQYVDGNGCGSEEPDYFDVETIHVIQKENNDFRPLLRSQFAETTARFLKQRRQLYPDDLVKAIASNDLEECKFLSDIQITPLWPFDHPQYHSETAEKFLQQMFFDCQILQPLSSEMLAYLEEELQFRDLAIDVERLGKKYTTPADILDTVCASLVKFRKYVEATICKKGLSHHHLNLVYFSLIADKYEELLKTCQDISRKVFKEIEVPLTKLLFPLVEFSRFWSMVNHLRALKFDLIAKANEPIRGWSEVIQQFDRVQEIKKFFDDYHFGHVQFHLVDTLIGAFLKLQTEIRCKNKKNDQSDEPSSYDLYLVMKDIATLDKILKYIDNALTVNITDEDSSKINNAQIGKLVLERVLQVCGEYVKNEDETPHLSEIGQNKLLKAGVPIARMTHLRNMLSHCSTLMAFTQHTDDIDIATLKNVQNDLKKIKRVIGKVLQQREFLQVKILMRDIPLHQHSGTKDEVAKEYVKEIEMCTTREMLKKVIERMCSLSDQQTKTFEFHDLEQTIQEILFMMNIKDVTNAIRVQSEAVLGTLPQYTFQRPTNVNNFEFFCKSDAKSSITAILDTQGIANFYSSKLKADKCKKIGDRSTLAEIFIKDLMEKALPKFKSSLESTLTEKDLKKCKTDCICVEILKTFVHHPELSEDRMNVILNELFEESISCEDIFKVMKLPDSSNVAFQNFLQDYQQRVKNHLKPKEILDGIIENTLVSAQELLPMEEFEQLESELKKKIKVNFAKTKLSNLCSGIRKVSKEEFNDLVSNFQSKDHEKVWSKSYLNRQKCKTQVNRVMDPYGDLLKAISKEKGFNKTLKDFQSFIQVLNISSNSAQFLMKMFAEEVEKQFENHFLKSIEILQQLGLQDGITKEFKQKYRDQNVLCIAIEMLVLQSLTTLKEMCTPKTKMFWKLENLIQISIAHLSKQKVTTRMASLRNYLAHGDALGDILTTNVSEIVLLAAENLARNGHAVLAIKTMIKDDQESSKLLETLLCSKVETIQSSLVTKKYKRQIETIIKSDYWIDIAWRTYLTKLISQDQGPDEVCDRNTVEVLFKALAQEFTNAICFNDMKMTQFCLDRGAHLRLQGNPECAMHFAAENGCLEIIDVLMKHKYPVNRVCQRNYTPLHVAVFSGQTEMVKHLLNNNANVDAKDVDQFTPLHIAAMIGSNDDILQCLIDHGANVQGFSNTKMTPMHFAAWNGHVKTAMALLDHGTEIDVPDKFFRTPLFLATWAGHHQIVSLLLEKKANANGNTNLKMPPLCVASMKQDCTDLVKLLLKNGANVNDTDIDSETALHHACYHNRTEIIADLIQNGADLNARNKATITPLHIVSILGNVDIANQLLEEGADIDGINRVGHTALHFAALKNHMTMAELLIERGANVNYAGKRNVTAFHLAIDQRHFQMSKLLLLHGADAHAPYFKKTKEPAFCEDSSCSYPLKEAIFHGDVEQVVVLLEAGVDKYKIDDSEVTALHYAAGFGLECIVQLLIDTGVSVNCTDSTMATPLHFSVIAGQLNVTQLLLRHGANVNAVNETKLAALHFAARSGFCKIIQLLIVNGADIHARNEDDVNALAFAVIYGQIDSMETLLELGFNVDAKGRFNQTALHFACAIQSQDDDQIPEHKTSVDKNTKLSLVKSLLQHEADVNVCDLTGRTPLHLAAKTGDTDVVQVLLEYQANINIIDSLGDTPMQIAKEGGHTECCKYLIINDEVNNLVLPNSKSVESTSNFMALPSKSHSGILSCDEWQDKLCEAVQEGNVFLVNKLLSDKHHSNSVNPNVHNLLHVSVTNADTAITELLLKSGANINHLDPVSGLTPLHLAVNIGYLKMTNVLLDNGADVHCLTQDKKQSPMHLAVQNENTDIISLLLSRDATLVNKEDNNMDTPLKLACQVTNMDMVDLLLAQGAHINGTRCGQDAPIHAAILKNNIPLIDLLLCRGADIHAIGKDDNTSLHYCMQRGNICIAQRILDLGVKVNCINKEGQTPLHIAVKNEHRHAVEFLIRNKAEVNSVFSGTDSPLHLAVRNGHKKTVDILIENGADLNGANDQMQTPLHIAAFNDYYEIVELLHKKGAKIDAIGKYNCTPLLLAIQEGHYGITNLMLTLGANVNLSLENKWTGIHLAILRGDSAMISEVLLAGADVNCIGKDGWTPLHLAVSNGSLDNVRILTSNGAEVNISDINELTPLHIACNNGYCDISEHLIAVGANVNIGNDKGYTPLILAIKQGNSRMAQILMDNGADKNHISCESMTPLHYAILHMQNIEMMQILLKNGVDVNKVIDSNTYLHFASYFGTEYAVKTLIDHGLSVNVRMKNDVTPLHLAALKDNVHVISALMNSGADVNAVNIALQTPLHDAISMKHMDAARLLLENGANAKGLLKDNATLLHHASQVGHHEIIEALLDLGLEVDAVTTSGQTSLHIAAEHGHDMVVKALVKHGANTNAQDNSQNSPLHLACLGGHVNVMQHLLNTTENCNVKVPIIQGASASKFPCIDKTNNENLTPLQIAIANRHDDMSIALIEMGASINLPDDNGDTPLMLAIENCRDVVAYCLITAGADVNAANSTSHRPLHKASQVNNVEIFKHLLKNGANLDEILENQGTLLHHASCIGSTEIVEFLLELGLKLDAINCDGQTPLHLASSLVHYKIVAMLLEHGANPNAVDQTGKTPLHFLTLGEILHASGNDQDRERSKYLQTAKLLIMKGANVDATDTSNLSALHIAASHQTSTHLVELILENNGNANGIVEENVCTPLHYAAEGGHSHIIELLLNKGAVVDRKNEQESTALFLAAYNGHLEAVKILLQYNACASSRNFHASVLHAAVYSNNLELIKLILDKLKTDFQFESYINAQDNDGDTALMWAAENELFGAANILLQYGANVDIKNNSGMTVIEFSTKNGHYEILKILSNYKERLETV